MRRQEWEAQQVKRPRWEPQDQSRKKPAGWNNPELEAPLEEPQKGTKRIPNQRWGGHKETWSSLAAAEEPRKKRRRAGRGHLKRGWSGPRGRGRGRGWSGPGRAFAAEARDPGGPTWQPHESFHEQARGRYNEEDSDAEAPDKLGEWSPESEAGDAESVGKEGGRVSGRKGEPQADAPAPAAPAVPTVVTSSAPPSGKRSTARAKWMPCKEVANFWMNQCQVIIGKKTRGYLRTTCPRPWLPDHSTQTPSLNKRVVLQLKRPHLKRLSYACHKWQVLQNELLDMAAPAMTVYEMAEEALAKGEAVEPLELREWARHLLRYIGSLSQRLLLYRRGEVLAGINPQLRNMAQRMNDRTVNGRLFTDENMRLLEEVLNKFPYLTQASEWTRPGEALDGLRREPADRAQPDSTRHRFISEDFPDVRPSSSSFA